MINTYPISQMMIAPENPRQEAADEYIQRLAANIKAQGLKQNLVGYLDGDTVFITAGGCRLRALKALAADDDGHLEPLLKAIPVNIEHKDLASRAGLSENVIRAEMNVVDRMFAYKRLHEEGMSVDDVCKEYSITKRAYENTMKIAGLPTPILDALRIGEMALDHAAAFATGSPERALEVYEETKSHGFTLDWGGVRPQSIVKRMTEQKTSMSEGIAKYVGLKAYEKAGGTTTTDLFGDDVYLDDSALVESLAHDKLMKAKAKLEKEWAWVEAHIKFPGWEHTRQFSQMRTNLASPLTEEEAAEYDELASEIESYGDIEDDIRKARFQDLEAKAEARDWTDEQKKVGGVIIAIGHDGKLRIEEGYVRKEDVKQAKEGGVLEATAYEGSEPAGTKDPLKWSDAVSTDVHYNFVRASVQADLVTQHDKLQQMLADHFTGHGHTFDFSHMPRTMLDESQLAQGWKLPVELEAAYLGQVKKKKLNRKATVSAVLAARITSDTKAKTDLRKWWTPNAAFFNRLTKPQLCAVLHEIGSRPKASEGGPWDTYKKGDLVKVLDEFFAGTRTKNSYDNEDPALVKVCEAAKTWLPKKGKT